MPEVTASMGEEPVISNEQKESSAQKHTGQCTKNDTPIVRLLFFTHNRVHSFPLHKESAPACLKRPTRGWDNTPPEHAGKRRVGALIAGCQCCLAHFSSLSGPQHAPPYQAFQPAGRNVLGMPGRDDVPSYRTLPGRTTCCVVARRFRALPSTG